MKALISGICGFAGSHIARYLSRDPTAPGRTFRVRCQHPGCRSVEQAVTFPAENEYLGIQPPKGWKVISRPPRTSEGKIVVDLHFFCPEHSSDPLT